MHLTLTSPAAPDSTDAHAIAISAHGITIGSDPHNDWVPDRDPHNLCAVQAAIRVENGVYTLVNLASRLPVTVNGSALPCQSSARLQPGDEITLGACRVTAQARPAEARQVTPVASPVPLSMHSTATDDAMPTPDSRPTSAAESLKSEARPTRAAETLPPDALPASTAETLPPDARPAPAAADVDPFADLLGPGTLPLGAASTLDSTHPFEMASAAPRNAADPLAGWAERPDDAHAARTRDPLDLFAANASDEVPDVFTDHTPSVLDRDSRKRS